jgi:hypothetical protein
MDEKTIEMITTDKVGPASFPMSSTGNIEVSQPRSPDVILDQARVANSRLKAIIAKKARPVMINGKQYLEYEDWALIAKFYGVTAKVTESKFVEVKDHCGYESKAVAYELASGKEISGAFGMCMNDEVIGSGKTREDWTLQRLRSLSQTRACAKVLKNVFSWVAVLGGYAPTPAEEMVTEPMAEVVGDAQEEVSTPVKVAEIKDWLHKCAKGDANIADEMLRNLTTYKNKDGVTKWVNISNLESIGRAKPDWISRIHSNVFKYWQNAGKPQ